MQKVTTGEILLTIYENRTEAIASLLAEGHTEIPYHFQNFEKDMLTSELVVDPRTIRSKWKLLIANGAIRETNVKTHHGVLSLQVFRPYMTDILRKRLILAEGERVRERDTHMQGAVE